MASTTAQSAVALGSRPRQADARLCSRTLSPMRPAQSAVGGDGGGGSWPCRWNLRPLLATACFACGGPAACGRLRRWAGAQPCSYTHAPMRPAQAAVGDGGSGVPWPRPRRERPSPRGPKLCSRRVGIATSELPRQATGVVTPMSSISGLCRRYLATDAPFWRAVGGGGVGLLGRRTVVAARRAPVMPVSVAVSLTTLAKWTQHSQSCLRPWAFWACTSWRRSAARSGRRCAVAVATWRPLRALSAVEAVRGAQEASVS